MTGVVTNGDICDSYSYHSGPALNFSKEIMMATPIDKFTKDLTASFAINFVARNKPTDFPIPVALDVDYLGDGTAKGSVSGYFVSEDVWDRMVEELEARKELADAFLSADYHRIARSVLWVERVTQHEYVTNERPNDEESQEEIQEPNDDDA